MEKIAIYSASVGAYDSLIQPFNPEEGFDFICFVPQGMKKEENVGYWKIEELPISWPDNTLTARFPKLNPQTVLDNYEWSLWIDGNVGIMDKSIYDICKELQRQDVKYAGIIHPDRDCTYEEAEAILENGRENLITVLHAVRFLHKNGLKRHAGLQETNVLFRKHNDKTVIEFDRWWWECLLEHAAGHRDQLMHTFCLMDTPSLSWNPFLPEENSTKNFHGFAYVKHLKTLNQAAGRPWIARKFIYGRRHFNVLILRLYLWLFVK